MRLLAVALISAAIGALITLALTYIPGYIAEGYITPVAPFIPPAENPLDRYSFERLSDYEPQPSEIELSGVITQEELYSAYLMKYTTENKVVSGQLNKPKQGGRLPAIIMLRGFVDQSIYQTGIGTRNAAAVFARNGYVTLAPDFLGYGESDPPANDSFAARVQRPVTVLDLIASVKQLDYVDPDRIGIWGHSNGGQIALSILEITRAKYPTTLWAPQSKPFPYSILYYTDEYGDYGKGLRKALATFELTYDTDLYSIYTYVDRIEAPIQFHQGGYDDAIPQEWSDDFVAFAREQNPDIDITYYTYPQADHNLRPDWNTVVQRDLDFFAEELP